jgi:pyruvate dehydrogenase E2 component (dihydrolipoamide acetyltransferase)
MATQVLMPRLSDSMEQGKIIRWLKKEGEAVKKGEALVEIESDKANIEVEAVAAGVLSKIVVPEGQSAAIGAPIAEIGGTPGEKSAAPAAEPAAAPAPAPAKAAAPAKAKPQAREPEAYPEPEEEPGTAPSPVATATPPAAPAEPAAGERLKASPLARRLAEDLGVDLSQVQGTGPQGRIVREDIEAAASAGKAAPADGPARAARSAPAGEMVELSGMQAAVARRLAQSMAQAPHFYVTAEIAVEDLVHLRAMINEALPKEEAVSFNDLVVKAAAQALTKLPDVNASWADGRIERKRAIHIGIAVNVEHGLYVPVLRNVDQKSVKTIAGEARGLIEKARARKLQPADYEGGTFTVSNLGMFDVDQFTAIINPPESAILAVGSILDKPVLRNGHVVPGKRLRVTLSVDHRVFYGATAAQFLQELKRLLETPAALLV